VTTHTQNTHTILMASFQEKLTALCPQCYTTVNRCRYHIL